MGLSSEYLRVISGQVALPVHPEVRKAFLTEPSAPDFPKKEVSGHILSKWQTSLPQARTRALHGITTAVGLTGGLSEGFLPPYSVSIDALASSLL